MTKQMMVLTVLFVYVFLCSLIEPHSLTVKKYTLEDKALAGVRAVFVSDFHLKPKQTGRLDRIVKTINKQQADVVFFGGDFLDGHSPRKTIKPYTLVRKLNNIQAPKYAVMGENDWWAGGEDFATTLSVNGIRVLRNSSVRTVIRRRYVDVVGLDDLSTQDVDLAKAFYRTREPRILLSHNPDIYYDVSEHVNLILAGHTHGGQFVLPFSPPLLVPSKYGSQFAKGLIELTATKMIITTGVGTSGLPLRFNCKPEIVVIDFVVPGSVKDVSSTKKRKR